MILTKNIIFRHFFNKKKNNLIKKKFDKLTHEKNEILNSLSNNYKYSFSRKKIKNLRKNFSTLSIIGMGGSILGMKAIYNFLNFKRKKKVYFYDNLIPNHNHVNKKKNFNIIISKSGETLETILNANVLLKRGEKNFFITQNQNNFLRNLAKKMKAEVIDHNNFIGGRYSVLSEVGMLPASLIGLNERNFKQYNNLIKNKKFIDTLIGNVSSIIFYLKKKKFNSVIINYDENSDDLFKWYQQLVGESLGKDNKGIYPLVSTMPKDNHSLMQLYLDGPKKSFFTLFNVKAKKSNKVHNHFFPNTHNHLKNLRLSDVLSAQKQATEIVFKNKKIPFRSFEILNRSEKTLGELFTFFILETILIGKALNVDPYSQPAVEMIKNNTNKILRNN